MLGNLIIKTIRLEMGVSRDYERKPFKMINHEHYKLINTSFRKKDLIQVDVPRRDKKMPKRKCITS